MDFIKKLQNYFIGVLFYSHAVLMILTSLFYFYWYEGGKFFNCFGRNYKLEDPWCDLLVDDSFYLGLLLFVLWSFVLTSVIYFLNNNNAKIALFRTIKNASFGLVILFLSLFLTFSICLFGCLEFHLGLITAPVLLTYLVLIFVYSSISYMKINERKKSLKYAFILNIVLLIISGTYVYLTIVFGDYLSDKDLLKLNHPSEYVIKGVSDGVELTFETTEKQIRRKPIGISLMAADTNVKIAVLDKERNVIMPKGLRQISTEPYIRYGSSNRNYFIEDGIIYAGGSNDYPYYYFIEGIKPGFVTLAIGSTWPSKTNIQNIPVFKGTKMWVRLYLEDDKLQIDKVRYDLEGDGYSEKEISWIEGYKYDEHIRDILVAKLKKANLSNQDLLGLINLLESKNYTALTEELSKFESNANIEEVKEITAGAILLNKI